MKKSTPNDTLTARPRIFFRGKRIPADSEETQRLWDAFGIEPHESTREFTPAYISPETEERREMEAATTPKDRATLAALVLMQRAYSHVKSPMSAKDLSDAASLLIPGWRPPQWALDVNRREASVWLYPALLREAMKGARLVMVRAKGGFVPAIFCRDLRTALFVYAAYRGVEVCVGCRRLFAPDPERCEKYCSDACGQRYWQKQYRLREKRKRAARKSKRSRANLKGGGKT